MRTTSRVVCGLALGLGLTLAVACTGRYESDFPLLVVNRTANTLEALANGTTIGEVTAGQTGSFTLTLPESNANVFNNGTAPTPHANVTLTAKDTRTGSLSAEKAITLTQGSPTMVSFSSDDFPSTGPTVARFTFSPTNPTINQEVSFNASASSASNGTYAWDFGDGQSGTGVTAMHRYTRAGTFTITLIVTSDTRQTSTSSRTLTASATLPATAANFTFSPTNPSINQDIVFTASGGGATPPPVFFPVPGGDNPFPGVPFPGGPFPGVPIPGVPIPGVPVPVPVPGGPNPPPDNPGGDPGRGTPFIGGTVYQWDFGDGTSAIGNSVTHHYSRGGTYSVTLRVTSDAGLTATTSRQVTVSATLPGGSANFVFSPTDPHVDDDVFFNASSSTLLNGAFAWDFGDGSSGAGVTPTHSFGDARTYTVTLTVTSELGQRATTSKTVTVSDSDD